MAADVLLGRVVVEAGYLTQDQWDRAVQAWQRSRSRLTLTEFLIQQRLLTPSQAQVVLRIEAERRRAKPVATAVAEQARSTLTCVKCNHRISVVEFDPQKVYRCPRCSAVARPSCNKISQTQNQPQPRRRWMMILLPTGLVAAVLVAAAVIVLTRKSAGVSAPIPQKPDDPVATKPVEPPPPTEKPWRPKPEPETAPKSTEKSMAKTTPEQMVSEADRLMDRAKERSEEARRLGDGGKRAEAIREGLDDADRARILYSATQGFVSDEMRPQVGEKQRIVMQLIRLLRDQLKEAGSKEVAVEKSQNVMTHQGPSDAEVLNAQSAMDGAVEAFKRFIRSADRTSYRLARDSAQDARVPAARALLTAIAVSITRVGNGDWVLSRAQVDALEKYLQAHNPAEFHLMAAGRHAAALESLVSSIRSIKVGEPWTLKLLAWAHLDALMQLDPKAPQIADAAAATGLTLRGGVAWTAEGLALREARRFLDAGDEEQALRRLEGLTDFSSKYVRNVALIIHSVAKEAEFDKAALVWFQFGVPSYAEAHRKALYESVHKFVPCSICKGSGLKPCPKCRGKGSVQVSCTKCGGLGRKPGTHSCCTACCEKHKGRTMSEFGCSGKGTWDAACPPGVKCAGCKEAWKRPLLTDIFKTTLCPVCNGSASLFERVLIPCPSCLGLGERVVPAADPTKLIERE